MARQRNDPKRDAAQEESAREALERARGHVRAALAEAIEAVRALLDATSLATNGVPAGAHPALKRVTTSLDQLASQLAGDSPGLSPPLIGAILDALDAEIGRWELRSESDPEARAVLRAFIGVREILWEFGLRRDPARSAAPPRGAKRRRRGQASEPDAGEEGSAPSRRARVQRVEVQG